MNFGQEILQCAPMQFLGGHKSENEIAHRRKVSVNHRSVLTHEAITSSQVSYISSREGKSESTSLLFGKFVLSPRLFFSCEYTCFSSAFYHQSCFLVCAKSEINAGLTCKLNNKLNNLRLQPCAIILQMRIFCCL